MRLLLDAHLSPELADALVRAGIDAVALQAFEGGRLLRASDHEILEVAAAVGRILLTADRRSIMPLRRRWAEDGRTHAGVIVISGGDGTRERIGSVVRRLSILANELSGVDWINRFVGLPRD